MKDRIRKFIDYKKISPGELADLLEVQRSNISHILNGRNKPGAAFIEKFLIAFPNVNARWLFTGDGSMLTNTGENPEPSLDFPEVKSEDNVPYKTKNRTRAPNPGVSAKTPEKVVLLYPDGTFSSYNAG